MIKRFTLFLLIALLSVSCNEDTTVGPEDPGSGTSFSILLLSPVGGESVKIGTTKAIRWSSNTTNTIKIELSTDGGTTFSTIAASVANIGIYNWTVPSTASTVCLIRVSDAVNASVNDVTDNFFTIEQSLVKTLSLTRPNGGDTLIAGQSASIQWASSNIANVKLQYSSDNGVSWNTIVSSYPADSSRYTWSPVPNIFSPDCRIRVADAAADTLFDISDNKFLIRSSQTVTVLSPNSGENLPRGGSYIIAWQATDISSVKIEYSTNDGNSWNVITASTPNDGSHDWNPVADVNTTQGRIRISDAADGTPSDISDGPFSISSQPSITVTSPTSGESITAGSRKTINWVSTSERRITREEIRSGKNDLSPEVDNVAISYSTDGGTSWTNIVSSLPNTGSYSWDPVPAALTTNGKIRVRDISDTTVFGLSSGFFTIIAAPVKSLTVVSPNGGESWSPGTDQVVTWTSANISTVKIELSTNNGSSWSTLASNIDATAGSYTLLGVPNSPSALCKIRISESPVSTVSDQSDAVFTITPQSTISVTAPNGGESILSGGSTNITWVAENLEFVKIEYTTNNGFTWTTITNSTESDGFYTWSPVPAVFSTNCKIRISDAADGHPFDVSNDVFSILAEPVIQVTAPNGGERLLSGSSYQIQWNTVTPGGNARSSKKPRTETDDPGVTDVRIELSTDGGAVWSSITATTPNTGSYLWSSVPNLNSALCKIRISDASDGIPTDQSDSVFIIYNQAAQSIAVTSPNGGEQFTAGSTTNITWSSSGVAAVLIEFTTNNGVSWSQIANNVVSTGVYTWNPLPAVSSGNCKIRISDAGDSIPSAQSQNTFTIVPQPSVRVISPNGGEIYYSGTTRTINWESASLEKVKLEFTTNNGSSWQIISDSTESDGSFDWSVPVLSSSLCKVRVSGIINGTPSDVSDAVFSITNVQPQSITVTSPNGGESFTAGVPQRLTWLSAGIDSAKIEYTTNNGVSWTTIINSTPSTGSYIWTTVPSVNSANCKIRISDALDNTPTDESNNVFSIVVQPQLLISSPNGGESILAGSAYTIQWTTLQGKQTESVTSVKIEFSSDAGLSWSVLSTSAPNTGSYNWNPVPNISSALCRVRISEAVTGSPSDISDSNFTVYNVSLQTITVTSPNGGEIIQPGGNFNLTWNSSGIANVNIELTTNNGLNWSTVVNGTESDGFYLWTPPSNVSSTNCKIRIYDAVDSLPSDESNSTFTILPTPTVQVLSPNGGEQLIAGAQHTITWLSQNISAVKLEFTTNNGAGWVSIADSTESDGQFIWTVPAITSSLCKIRVSNQQTGSPQDISDNVFTITTVTPQSVTVTLPNGGESIPSGSSQVITWTSSGIDSVKIEFTTNNGVSWSTVVNKTESDGFYLWNPVPATSSTNCKIRISDANDGIPFDESNGVFTIAPEPAISVIAPNGGERWTFGTSQDVRWHATNLANVKIEFSTNSGFSWVTIVDSTPSTGSYSWTIPNINSSLCKIRVSDPVDGVPFDISDSNFTLTNQIQQSLTVTSPNGGENFEATSAHSITWTSSAINKVKIEFSTNNGLSWSTVTDSTESDGQYEWNPIPSVSSTLCKVRISDAADGSPVDESNNTFTISPNKFITVLYPDGGENLTAGTVYNILWSSQGVTNVSIEYRIGNTGSYESIISSTPSDGSYEWSPTVPAAFYKLRIKNADDATPLDESNGTFTVLAEPSVTLLTPDGGQSLQAGTSYDITWVSTGLSAVKLELTTNNGASWSTIVDSTESDGSYTWVVNNVNSNLCKIRISDQADGLPASSSTNVFRIYNAVPKTLTVTAPNGGEVLSAGEQTNITWVSSGIDSVKIEYSTNNGQTWTTLAGSVAASGFYLWNPLPSTASTNYLVKISESSTGFPFDVSDGVFTINPEPVLRVLTPNGGESWLAGSQQQIRWLSQNVTSVDIDFSSNNGATWSSVVTGLASTGTYTWANVPSVNSDQCRIRVKDAADGSPNDISDSTFAIVQTPYIRVIFPNGGGQSVTSDTTIIWTSVGVTNVDLELTLDNAATAWTTIAANIASTGAYRWTLIPQFSSLARIRVTAVGDTTIRDMSDGTFNVGFVPPGLTIRKSIGAALQTGKPLTVPYTSDTEREVTLEYSLDEGNTWLTGAANVQSMKGDNTGLIPWKKEFEGRMIYIRIRSLDSDVQSIPVLISLE